MANKRRRKVVSPGLRREWLRRFENGESVPHIADSDYWDVRTVRKQLDLARQEREVAEARHGVLRQALQDHYTDLCSFAEKIDAGVAKEFEPLCFFDWDARMLRALQQHLPKSRIWKLLGEWEDFLKQLESHVGQIRKQIVSVAEDRLPFKLASAEGELDATKGFIQSLVSHFLGLARGWKGLEGVPYVSSRAEGGQVRVEHRPFAWVVPEGVAAHVEQTHSDLKVEGLKWEEYERLKSCSQRLIQVRDELRDELAVLILRRVLPGRCVYCPL